MQATLSQVGRELDPRLTLVDAATTCALGGGLVLGSLIYNPEIWWRDYPAEVKAAAGPQSARARREAALLVLPFGLALFGTPIYSSWRLRRRRGGRLSFAAAFANAFLVAFAFNLFDLFAIDLPLVKFLPRAWLQPGTEEAWRRNNSFAPHVRGAVKGLGFCLVEATVAAALTGVNWRRRQGRPGRG
ncbi:MAG: hypothetical protein ACYC4L_17200 [Chloroflexota bacterium]